MSPLWNCVPGIQHEVLISSMSEVERNMSCFVLKPINMQTFAMKKRSTQNCEIL